MSCKDLLPFHRTRGILITRSIVGNMNTRQKVVALYDQGYSRAEIANALGIAKSTVSYHLKKVGSGDPASQVSPYDWDEIQRFYDEYLPTHAEISQKFGVSLAGISKAIRTGRLRKLSRIPFKRKTKAQVVNSTGHRRHSYQSIREHAKRLYKIDTAACSSCGWDRHVEVCHRKAIADFPDSATVAEINAKSNIVLLCPNCHWLFDNGFLAI